MNTLIYSMGDEADDIMRSFGLSVEDAKNYSTVLAKFEAHFVKRRNVIFERAKFNMRRQEEGESVDAFITALYGLAEHCGYGNLHDEMVRDRIVVGIRNAALSEKLQLDAELTLEKAVTYVRQSETVKQQQTLLRDGNTMKPDTVIGAVQGTREPGQGSRRQRSSQWASRGPTQNQCGSSTVCSRCWKFPAHDREHCPAKDAICIQARALPSSVQVASEGGRSTGPYRLEPRGVPGSSGNAGQGTCEPLGSDPTVEQESNRIPIQHWCRSYSDFGARLETDQLPTTIGNPMQAERSRYPHSVS